MKYIKKFENHEEYEAFTGTSEFVLPNVSLCVNENEVHYNPSSPTPPTPSHDYVEIGGIKWATMNVGAESITDSGLYFQWGDTQGYTASQVGSGSGQKAFSWADYKWTEDGGSTFTKYNGSDKTVLDLEDDAVNAAWGSSWRIPTTAEFQALGNAVNTAWTQVNGISGLMCTDKTDETKTLFFPVAGYANNGSVISGGLYWSSSPNNGNVGLAYRLGFSIYGAVWNYDSLRYYGYPVRGVLAEN
jgi:hypothetical protein